MLFNGNNHKFKGFIGEGFAGFFVVVNESYSMRVLIVEDEEIISIGLAHAVTSCGYEVCARTGEGSEAIDLAKIHRPDAVLMDITIEGDIDGVEVAKIIGSELGISVIFISSYSDSLRRP